MNKKRKREEIRIRDPFVAADRESMSYYLFGTTDSEPWYGKGEGFLVYRSSNLEEWEELGYAFLPVENFWADKNFWAPEVHSYKGRFYMLASFKAEGKCRGVQILASYSLAGPYEPISEGAVTPPDWECLDGTLYLDEEGVPWLVFSHEWTQIQDGTVCCARLTDDLKELTEEPKVLFHASEAPWSTADTGEVIKQAGENYVTDGPFLFKTENGTLQMLWSSFSKTGYAMGLATSRSGLVSGPWMQQEEPFYEKDGGHGMLFRSFAGELMLAIHTPNDSPYERAVFLPVTEDEVKGLKKREKGMNFKE